MPRPNTSGSEALGLTEDLDGVTEVKQGASRFDGVVIDFTKVIEPLIPDGTECTLEIKTSRPAITTWGAPQVGITVEVQDGEYETKRFFENFDFSPPNPPYKGRMWLVHSYCEAVNYELPSSISGAEIMPFLKQFAEDCLGESFQAVIGIYQSKTPDKNGDPQKPKNTIKRILKAGSRSIDDLLTS